jgi:hypothetical protein
MYCAVLSEVLFTIRCTLRDSKEIGSGKRKRNSGSVLTDGLITYLQSRRKSASSRV